MVDSASITAFIIDAPVVILPEVFGASIYDIEIFVAVVAVLALVFIVLSRRAFRDEGSRTEINPYSGGQTS